MRTLVTMRDAWAVGVHAESVGGRIAAIRTQLLQNHLPRVFGVPNGSG